jgi:hypothetical protein
MRSRSFRHAKRFVLRRNELNDLEAAMRNRSFRYVTSTRLGGGDPRCAAAASAPLASLHRFQIVARLANGGRKKVAQKRS